MSFEKLVPIVDKQAERLVKRKLNRRSLAQRMGSFRVPDGVTPLAIRGFLQSLDCPRSLTVWMLFSSNEHAQLLELECNDQHYETNEDFADAYAATCFLSKFNGLNLPTDPREVAIAKFLQFEEKCSRTNRRFKYLDSDPLFKGQTVYLHDAVIRKISKILGRLSAEEFVDFANWGPGASTDISSRDASATIKFHEENGITQELYSFLTTSNGSVLEAYPLWHNHLVARGTFPRIATGNKVVTVPKNAKTDRVIAIEPGFNTWFQKAIGTAIESRLRWWGIDLRYQKRNQLLARKGSLTSSLATIDFSSASDSISRQVVFELLPVRWYELLDACRSHRGVLNDVEFCWNKFSSMGNGFTFPLQTLIFASIALCCCELYKISTKDVSVYGDDVIIPVDVLGPFSTMCAFYGFTINDQKSFTSGHFRESCGAHYIMGVDVKPVYLKENLQTLQSVYRFANAVRRYAHRRMMNLFCDKRFYVLHRFLVLVVPKPFRIRIPETLGDGGFISNFDEASPTRAKHWIEGFNVRHATDRSSTTEFDGDGLLFARLWSASILELRNSVVLRGRTRLTLTRSLVARWYNLGSWL